MAVGSNDLHKLALLLKPGMKVSAEIQFGPEDTYIFHTALVGHKIEQYIVLEFPQGCYEALVMRKLNNVQIILRGICDTELGHILAFKSSIIQASSKPFCVLFLRPPKHFATKAIRSHERYKLAIPAELNQGNKSYTGSLIDFSVSGCGVFIAGENELNKGSGVSINSELDPLLPTHIDSHIVNIRRQPNGHLIGIQFAQPIQLTESLKKQILEQAFLAGSL
ncbi:flagellar brake protein (plasmid) [Vibrio sp. HDW18]|uniref:PilZ domain-containing protein n=1 Tax=Vibrio sp. HDW18 TaxID=2714948 RepID=UPI00140BBBBB|nr:PilZ domain-containing protein [Vibrio sp. HDW18]QIL86874.1 flagellar brake protein [Vibrio sp. HDW18]